MRLQLEGKNLRSFFKADEIDEIDRSAYISASLRGLEKDLVRLEVKVYNLFRLLLTSSNPTLSKKNFK